MNQGDPVAGPVVVLGEGKTEHHLLCALKDHYNLTGVDIPPIESDKGGKSNFGRRLGAFEPKVDEGIIDTFVLVADNDSDPDETFAFLQDQVVSAPHLDLDQPSEPWQSHGEDPGVAIVTLPEADREGTTETLILEVLEDEGYQDEIAKVKKFIDGAPAGNTGRIAKTHKAQLSAFLAATCEDDPSCRAAVMWYKQRYEPLVGHRLLRPLVDFLRTLPRV